MIVLVAGGTGFLGKHVVALLEKEGHTVIIHHKGFQAVPTYADVIINCVGIIRGSKLKFREVHLEKTKWLVKLAKKLGVRQFVQVSAIGARLHGTPYQSKRQSEIAVEKSGIPYAIIRPTVIFGEGDKSISLLKGASRTGFVPRLTRGKLQPVSVHTVASLVVAAAHRKIRNKIVDVGGPEIFSYDALADRIHPGVTVFSIPKPFTSIITLLGSFLPFLPTKDMIRMASEDSVTRDRTVYRLKIKNPRIK